MNNENGRGKKLRHGSASLGITAAVILGVLLLNALATAIFTKNVWFIDLSPQSYYNTYYGDTERKSATLYSLMDETVMYLDNIFESAKQGRAEDDPLEVNIIFCNDKDILDQNDTTRYVHMTAKLLQKQFPDIIHIDYRDVWSNPSSVDEYRSTSYATIYQTDVIIASDFEYRISSINSFYVIDTDSSMPFAYNGQKVFVKQILDVTGAERPVCCLTTNHGEPFGNDGMELENRANWPEYKEFINVLEGAGFEVRYLNMETEEIPENCRLIITLDPTEDFKSERNGDKTTETKRLDAFLAKGYSYMVFFDADTPRLPNLEEYLEEWGIAIKRADGVVAGESDAVTGTYHVTDSTHALTSGGESFVAQYAPGRGAGTAALYDIINSAKTPKIYFENATALDYSIYCSEKYVLADSSTGAEAYTYGLYNNNGIERAVYDMFWAGNTSSPADYTVQYDGNPLLNDKGNPLQGTDVFRLMALSVQHRPVAEGQGDTSVDRASYVCAVASTSFVSDTVLKTTAYGNTDVLLSTLRYIGKEVHPVGISYVLLHATAMDTDQYLDEVTAQVKSGIITTTVVLVALPAVTMLGVGIFVLVRRRVRH